MPKIKKITLFSFVTIVMIVFTSDDLCFVSAQDVMATDYWTPIMASLPSAFMGVINLALVSRLASNTNRGGIFDGFSRFIPGSNSDKQKKMIFLGKHNIQVSNSHTDSGGDGFNDEEEECCDEEENENDDEEEDEDEEDGDEEEEEEEENDKNKGKDKNKYKKVKKDKYKNSEDEDNDYKYKKQQNSGYPLSGYEKYPPYKPYGGTEYDEINGMDLKIIDLKNAIADQYPNIDPGQVYWPQSEESMSTRFHSDPNPLSKPKVIVTIPNNLPTKGKTLLPIFEQSSQVLPDSQISSGPFSNSKLPVLDPDQLTLEKTTPSPFSNSKPYIDDYQHNAIELNGGQQYSYDKIGDNKYQNEDNMRHQNGFKQEFQPIRGYRQKRSENSLMSDSPNRAGNVPPLRHNKTTSTLDKISPDVIRLLLSAVNNRALNEKNEQLIEAKPEKHYKRPKKSYKKLYKKKSKTHPSGAEIQSKSSSNRVVTKFSVKESERQPIKYVPLENYKNILNYSVDRKQDRASRNRRKSKKNRYSDNEEEDNDEEENDVEEDDSLDDGEEDEEIEDNQLDDIPEEGHTTVQIIEKPDEKFNVGISSWMKRMFSFRSSGGRRRRRFFNRGNNFR